MFRILSIASLLIGVFSENSTISSFNFKSCGNANDIAQNIVMSLTPKLPVTDFLFDLGATFSKDITAGTSKYSITYNFIPLAPTTSDLCTELNNSNVTCPLSAGPIGIQSKDTVPEGISGTTVIKNEWFDNNNARILCLEFTIKV
jgi:hypothetical protein